MKCISVCFRVSVLVIILAAAPQGLFAQVDADEVDVVVGYNPVLADAVKVNIQGEIPESTTKPDTLNYVVRSEVFRVSPKSVLIKPIALQKEKAEDLETVYAKAGFGTQLSPLLEAYVNSKQSDKYNYGVYGKYISQNGTKENQDYSQLDAGASAKFFFNKKVTVPVNLFYNNDVVHYYGYDDSLFSFKAADVKQQFNNFGLNLGVENIEENELNVDYKLKGGFSRISDINKYAELNPFVQADIKVKLPDRKGHELGGSLLVDYYKYTGPNDYNNTIIGVKPFYNILMDDWSVKAAFEFNVDDEGKFEPLPDIEFTKDLIGDKLVFFIGADSYLKRNSFKSLTDENPFIVDTIDFKNSVFYEYYGGIRGSTYGNFSFNAKGYLKSIQDMAFFINDSLNMKRFYVDYSNANITGVNIELSYFTAGKLRILGALNAFTFTNIEEFEKPWHTPTMEWTFSAAYDFNKKLQISTDIFGVNKMYALLPGNVIETIDGTADVNFAATYRYSKYFNIFVNLNNIAGFHYQRYYNYPGYGFQALGGLSFSF